MANGLIDAKQLGEDAGGLTVEQTIRVAFAAGTPGTADDVTLIASAPYGLRVTESFVHVSTLIALATLTLRDATGGGGNALSDPLAAGTVGMRYNTLLTTTATIAAGGALVLRRSDRGVAGEVIVRFLRTG